MELKVQIKQAGKRENTIISAKLILKENPSTIRELIVSTVRATHAIHYEKVNLTDAFENGELSEVLIFSEEELKDKAASGKIDFGFLKNEKMISEEEAVEDALQAFDDGLVVIFIDGKRFEREGELIRLTGKETVTFVKLVMLSGRMW